ncbi:PREDICTED: uncharacterized protein LOC109580768 [Amphimedon queenslandica]|uniref:Death domain-containing protein n=1 Tax=Amphimedon queenslandica TaxID=400682 RepID=A0A1X7VCA1_AMPQE|nr:PREDICTED: uncharacterized protein LOC109580768 [Amphimedon queenslandica]|eukprot:XP_019849853.1 PREDICTED: uncharacterized protein LOC109580768 [Amphimedon queenslandica]
MASSSNQAYLYERPQLSRLCSQIRTSRWHQLGIQLEVDQATLSNIRDDGSIPYDEKRCRMFEKWLDGNSRATNKQLLEALRLKVIGEDAMAKEYEQTLVSSQQETNKAIGCTVASTQHEDNPTREVMEEMLKKAISTKKLTGEALQLQGMYHKLLPLVQTSCREDKLEPMKNILRSILQEKSLYQLAAIAKYLKEINSLSSVDQVFQFLVEKHFISYLNFQLLKEFATETICGPKASKKIEREISKYQKHFKSFMDIPEFSTLVQVFDKTPELNPSTIMGLPIVIISLVDSWKHRNRKELSDWIPFLKENKDLLQSIGYKCILITYAIFPVDLPQVMTFLNDCTKMEELKKNGITIEISEEATTMFKLLSPPDVSILISKLEAEMKVLQEENIKLKEMTESVKQTQEKMIYMFTQTQQVLIQTQDKITQTQKALMQNQEKLMEKLMVTSLHRRKSLQNGEQHIRVQKRRRAKSDIFDPDSISEVLKDSSSNYPSGAADRRSSATENTTYNSYTL